MAQCIIVKSPYDWMELPAMTTERVGNVELRDLTQELRSVSRGWHRMKKSMFLQEN